MEKEFTPKVIAFTFTLNTEQAVKEMNDFRIKHDLKDESQVLQLAYRFALNYDLQYGFSLSEDGETFKIRLPSTKDIQHYKPEESTEK